MSRQAINKVTIKGFRLGDVIAPFLPPTEFQMGSKALRELKWLRAQPWPRGGREQKGTGPVP